MVAGSSPAGPTNKINDMDTDIVQLDMAEQATGVVEQSLLQGSFIRGGAGIEQSLPEICGHQRNEGMPMRIHKQMTPTWNRRQGCIG